VAAGVEQAEGFAMMHGFVRLLQLAGLLGMGLSLLGMGLALYFRVKFVANAGPGPGTPEGWLTVLDAFREPGKTFLLSAILFVVAEIAARQSADTCRLRRES
jgi:hypothetical protein